MARVVKVFTTIRTNWKKSIFFTGVAAWGANFGRRKWDEELVRVEYCEKAKLFGDEKITSGQRPRRVMVFLNPGSRGGIYFLKFNRSRQLFLKEMSRKGRKLFEKNIAPILHLAGLEVTVVKTEREGQAKDFMGVIDESTMPDAIVVAGGDGTLMETVTGLLRRTDKILDKVPLGFVPLGETNSLAKILFDSYKTEVKWMCDATMAVVTGRTVPIDVMKIQGAEGKTVYSVSGLKWGAYQDAEERKPKYWFLGPLKHRFTYLMSAVKEWPPLIRAELSYTTPCKGCSKCRAPPPAPKWQWWHILVPPKKDVVKKDYSGVDNPHCGAEHIKEINAVECTVHNSNHNLNLHEDDRNLTISIGPSDIARKDFIEEGWRRMKTDAILDTSENDESISTSEFKLTPQLAEGEEAWYSIDSEQLEALPIHVQLLKSRLNAFVKAQ